MIKALLLVGAGGFLGSILRFLCYQYIDKYITGSFPIATFTVNIIGSLIIGMVVGFSLRENMLTAEWRLFLAVGFCGGFTTFSSFSNDNISLIQHGEFLSLLSYISTSVIIGIAAVYLGIFITK